MNLRIVLLGLLAAVVASTGLGAGRLSTHYPTVQGIVGEELFNSQTGMPYLDKDLVDFADGDWGDEEVEVIGLPDGLFFDKSRKIAGMGMPWYESGDSYHPLAGRPTTAGVYNALVLASWRDGVQERITIRFEISERAAPPAPSHRLQTHYTTIRGKVGEPLVNPETGTPYLDKDLCDFADGDWGDETVAISGMPAGLSFDKSKKIAGVGKPWYESDDRYHPLSGAPKKAGTYELVISARWRDGYSESVSITLVIEAAGQSSSQGADNAAIRRAFSKPVVLREAIWMESDVYGLIELKIGKLSKKGQVKITAKAYLSDGRKLSAPGVTADVVFEGDGEDAQANLEFPVQFKKSDISLLMGVGAWLSDGGTPEFTIYSIPQDESPYWVDCCTDNLDQLEAGSVFRLDDFSLPLPEDFEIVDDMLPDGVGVTKEGTKLVCEANAAKLKLTYQKATQTFKGSFTIFAEQDVPGKKPKLKKYQVRLVGVIYGGAGYGVATCGKLDSWRIRIAP